MKRAQASAERQRHLPGILAAHLHAHQGGGTCRPVRAHCVQLVRNLFSIAKSSFFYFLPRVRTECREDVPSSTEMVACLRDMLASWEHSSAHFIGHSFGSIVVAWMARNAKEMAWAPRSDPASWASRASRRVVGGD